MGDEYLFATYWGFERHYDSHRAIIFEDNFRPGSCFLYLDRFIFIFPFTWDIRISVASWPSHAGISLGRTLAPLMKIKPYYMRTNGIVPSFTPVNTSSHPVVFASGWSTYMFYSLHWIGTDPDEEVLSRNDAICTYIKIYLLGCYIYWRQFSRLN